MKKVIVLGSGMVGSAMAIDLAKNYQVTVCDIDPNKLSKYNSDKIETKQVDLSQIDLLPNLVSEYDLVINAVPGFMGYSVTKDIIAAGKDIVDISFFPEDSLELKELAENKNVTAVVDCGVAPGMCNVFLGYHYKRMKVDSYLCYVGGLPFIRKYPYQYKAPFSPIDVIEEYTRPARYVENSNIVVKDALSDSEFLFFNDIGTLEAFNTDGLRSLMFTLDVPNMKEKTLRYPGHIDLIKALKAGGFFDENEIQINGTSIKPIEFTNKILFKEWFLQPDEEEFTVMRVIIRGEEDGKKVEYTYDLFDIYDDETQTSSMARTTGYTATAVASLILEGKFNEKGLFPPEFLGFDTEVFNGIIKYLEDRNVVYEMSKYKLQ